MHLGDGVCVSVVCFFPEEFWKFSPSYLSVLHRNLRKLYPHSQPIKTSHHATRNSIYMVMADMKKLFVPTSGPTTLSHSRLSAPSCAGFEYFPLDLTPASYSYLPSSLPYIILL